MKNKSIRIASILLLVTLLFCTVALSGCKKEDVFEEVASWESAEIQLEITETSRTGTVTAEGESYSVVISGYYLEAENRWYYCFYDLGKMNGKNFNEIKGEEKAKAAMWVFEASKKRNTLTLTVIHDYTYARGESETDHKGKVHCCFAR